MERECQLDSSNIPDLTGPCDHDATHTNGVSERRCDAMLCGTVSPKHFRPPGVQTRIEKCEISSWSMVEGQPTLLVPASTGYLICSDV
jgi:hypothetical protein